ncbi:MAG: hypothetical protein LBV67_08320 [Streptococcaceae bacterium]|jgi:hypothetical protein|nr:hypothetical protein [Streptococcaceae bacterium]
MSDEEKMEKVRRLNEYVNRLQSSLSASYDLNFTQFKQAGSNNWAGKVKKSDFDEQYHDGERELKNVSQEIEEAILTSKSKMFSLALSIDDAVKKIEALAIATF